MNVLIACESSGTVREAFRARGHDAWSCDLLPADDGSSFHIQGDAVEAIRSRQWDLVIAHSPCTHLAVSGARHFEAKRADGRQREGIELFGEILQACREYAGAWAIENPVSIIGGDYLKRWFPDLQERYGFVKASCSVQPWQHGHGETKRTCFWTSDNLTPLEPTNIVDGRSDRIHKLPPTADRWKIRSKTYDGIAQAIADQWGREAQA